MPKDWLMDYAVRLKNDYAKLHKIIATKAGVSDYAVAIRLIGALPQNIAYTAVENERTQLEKCSYFETNLFELSANKSISYDDLDSFVIYMLMEGEVNLIYGYSSLNIKKGETVLLPASINKVEFEVVKEAKMLEVYLPV